MMRLTVRLFFSATLLAALSACTYSTSQVGYRANRSAVRTSSLRAAQSSGQLLGDGQQRGQYRGGTAYWIISPVYLDIIDQFANQMMQ